MSRTGRVGSTCHAIGEKRSIGGDFTTSVAWEQIIKTTNVNWASKRKRANVDQDYMTIINSTA
jgi:hypothetical protein